MRRVVDGVQELGVAPRAAHVLGRAAPDGVEQNRVGRAGHRVGDALDLDRMLPAVAEVVEVFERLRAGILKHVDEAGLLGVERAITELRVRQAPANIPGPDLVKVAVGPAHGRLQHQVQAVEADGERHLDPAPHRGLHVVKGDKQAGDAGGGHAARLRRSISRAQFHGSSSCSRDAGWPAIRRSTSAEPGARVDVVQLGADYERIHGRGAVAAAIGAGEQPRLSSEGDTTQRAFGGIVVRQMRPSPRKRLNVSQRFNM